MSTSRNRRKIGFVLLLAFILFSGAGCGVQSDKQIEDVSGVTTGTAVYIDGNEASDSVKHQLEVLVENAAKWRIAGDDVEDPDPLVSYMVTDLDHNGRLEILVKEERENEEDETEYISHAYEVNASEDGIAAMDTSLCGEDFLNALMDSETAYCDPANGEYHYVLRNEYEAYRNIAVLTLRNGKMIKGTIGSLATTKQSVRFSEFYFQHSLEEMTEEQMQHALELSYQEFCAGQGYPLEKEKIKLYHHELMVPQYTMMSDMEKQKRLNQMICDWVEQGLGSYYDLQEPELEFSRMDITVKYAGRDRVSLLLEAVGYAAGAAHANEYCDVLTLDLQQEKILTGEELLPKDERDFVEEDILEGDCADYHGGENYRKEVKKQDGKLFQTTACQGWQDVKIYQAGNDDIGVVIPLKEYGLDAYVYYELYAHWFYAWEEGGIAYPDVDWEAYRYQLLAPEYQRLQDYMPVLTGETAFTWVWDEWTEDEQKITKKKQVSLPQFFQEWGEVDYGETLTEEDYRLNNILFCDATQDGKMELALHFRILGGFYLLLHQEGKEFYGMWFGEREFQGVQTGGIYEGSGGAGNQYFYRLHFQDGNFEEELIGKREREEYYIQDQKVSEKEFEKWYESVSSERACWYVPEALQETGQEGR